MNIYIGDKKQNTILITLAVLLVIMLSGCKDDELVPEDNLDQSKPLQLLDTGYTVIKNDESFLISYTIRIKNPNISEFIGAPSVRITARNAEGYVAESVTDLVPNVYPNSVMEYSHHILNISENPAEIEIELINDGMENISDESRLLRSSDFTVQAVNYDKKSNGQFSISGEITNQNDIDVQNIFVSILFKDGNGKRLGGESTQIDIIEAGANHKFVIRGYSDSKASDYEISVAPQAQY